MEHTSAGNIVLSRSVCYAALGVLAVVFLVSANGAPGAQVWSLPQFALGLSSPQGVHFSQLLTLVRTSGEHLRERLHTTWLFFGVFFVNWAIVAAWGIVERRRLKLGIGRQEMSWVGWMSLLVFSIAVLYGIGTNGIVARQYPKIIPVSDVLALCFVLALPVFAWSRLQRRNEEDEGGEMVTVPMPRRAYHSLLHLDDDDVVPARARFQELSQERLTPESEETALRLSESTQQSAATAMVEMYSPSPLMAPPSAAAVTTINRLIEVAQAPVENISSESTVAVALDPIPEPIAAAAVLDPAPITAPTTLESAPAVEQAAVSLTPSSPFGNFRQHLQDLNEGWARIERAGMDIEGWFNQQRVEVAARLERHPGARSSESTSELSTDFLKEKLETVDMEWAAIRETTREIARWFGDIPEANR